MAKVSAPRSRESSSTTTAAEAIVETPDAAPSTSALTGDDEPPPVDEEVLKRVRAMHKAPSPDQRKAYLSQFDDAYCDELGTKTKAELVLREAFGWVVVLDEKKRAANGSLIRYTGARLIWLLDCAEALGQELGAQSARNGTAVEVKALAAEAERDARALLQEHEEVLEAVAGARPKEKRELESELIALKAPEDVAARLAALARLGQTWLQRKDRIFHVLVEEHGLTQDLVDRGAKAAKRLQDARPGARGKRLQAHDAPSVNRIEGRVLAEMKVAMKAVAAANRQDKTITLLVPGPGTRAALVGRTRKGDKKQPPPPDK